MLPGPPGISREFASSGSSSEMARSTWQDSSMTSHTPNGSDSLTVLIAHPSSDLYGSDRVLLESVSGLTSQGFRVIVTIPDTGPLTSELERVGADVRTCPTPVLRKSQLHPKGMLRLVAGVVTGLYQAGRLLSAVDPDIVYVNTLTVPLWSVVARMRKRPVLLHVHEAEGSASRIIRIILALPALLATVTVANSRFSAETLTSAVPFVRDSVVVVHNAVAGPLVHQRARNLISGPIQLLYMGRLSPRKGVDLTVSAVAELARRGIVSSLNIVGDVYPGYEWYEEELHRRVTETGLDDAVKFHGFQRSVWSFVAACDIVLVPSRLDESFGNTAVEAVLAARPAIVSQTTGLKEAGGGFESVRFVARDEASAIADAVEAIADDWAHFRKLAESDSVEAARRHDPAAYTEQIISVIHRSVGGTKRTVR